MKARTMALLRSEVSGICGTRNSETWFKGIDLLSRHYDKLKDMHTHSFPLEQAEEAILTLAGRRGGRVLGVAINPGM